ncbi:hypothetical protein [Prescottella equi]|uniref:Uncharacterized protein n=1 Tax=Rhodococcus phage REQ3 TaxID=1109714 RepID=G9FH88_9CAUD|nr:hypothetical protein [Prescottella equi]YP_005087233.1 hypothetical protein RoPhREQ3_gp41 [Rhodococcus phage REQ3]AEV51977.1 hypothetical protein [Rhodococcus phage REQ3]ERN43248.1 hypothetical protein H849_24304 [Prescottella equi NBRC 101255 = C 7]ORL29068.1 hypothetical protein A6I89_01935 [Prescottella equi]QPQ77266.1 hypothetical protein I6H09_00030 [Prescottella equi]SUE04883.1 Uncharacterised protein [Prescottella equi]
MAYAPTIIPRSVIKGWMEAAGIQWDDLRHIDIDPHRVELTYFRRDADGRHVLAGDSIATEKITVGIGKED